MSWVPPSLSEACAVQTTITNCQPSTFLFLQLVTSLFGQSKDDKNKNFDHSPNYGFSQHFDGGRFSRRKGAPQEYDFIIVGAGSAGCVLANRLTEISNWKVLLLEAGEEEPEVAEVPAFSQTLQRSSIDWNFMTQPSPRSCLARRNGQCAWPRGKVMGGSSVINFMIYIRGGPRDYDEWAAMGNPGWSYKDVLPYFKKSENNLNQDRANPQFHGVGGYLNVETFPYQDANVLALLDAYEEAGMPIMDQNGIRQVGASLLQHTSRDGERASTNVAFVRPIRQKRRNLIIETNAYALHVLIDPDNKEAYGVEYVKNGHLITAYARKEVIASCGALMTPKLLMLSGVGPADHLRQFGIKVIQDLPVGLNLQDHTTSDGVLFSLENLTVTSVDDNTQRRDIYYFKENHRGPLSSTGPTQLNAFLQSQYENEPDRPDLQYSFDGANIRNLLEDPILSQETNVLPVAYYDGLMLRSILLAPKSRGVIRLNDSDPLFGLPFVHANTFFEDIDLVRIIEGIQLSMRLLETKALRKIGVRLVRTPLPHCKEYEVGTDEYWACIITSYTSTMYHYCGTCKMGPKYDKSAVVDPKLRVYGIKNLRVVDASIMPTIPRGNTNAPTIMIAEKASDLIKDRWLKGTKPFHPEKIKDFLSSIFLTVK